MKDINSTFLKIDGTTHIPKYIQIREWIRSMIKHGRYQEGDKLESESKLASMWGVNRNTVRQAISDLVNEGILQKRNGVGTFVLSFKPSFFTHSLKNITSFAEDVESLGLKPKTQFLKQEVKEASGEIAKTLMLKGEKKIIITTRLRIADNIPLIIERSHLPYNEFKELISMNMELEGSLYKILTDKFGINLYRSVQSFQAIILVGENARLLKVKKGSPGIFLTSIIYDVDNIPIEVLHAIYRGDRYVFQVETGQYKPSLKV